MIVTLTIRPNANSLLSQHKLPCLCSVHRYTQTFTQAHVTFMSISFNSWYNACYNDAKKWLYDFNHV